MITQAAGSATDLVRQLLAFSRREAVKPKVVDVAVAVTALEKILKRTLGADIALVIEASERPSYVLIDPSQLDQIVMNLIVNARDAIAGTGRVTIRIGASDTGVVLEVSDTGSGMSPDVVARIFEPYYTTKVIGKGTGLGLATVHGIVGHAGGQIAVTSELGRGTTFRVALPSTTLRLEEALTTTERPPRGRVLVVDDDEHVRRLTERMLRHAGYDVTSASSGPEALADARRGSFDILLTDMVMPGMSGRDLAREVAREHPETHIIFMSGYHPGTPIPASQFIAKPFDRQTLLVKMDGLQALVRRARSVLSASQ
jgi:two-component system, cell cycle sensor histidine kinase and response regulator CckA